MYASAVSRIHGLCCLCDEVIPVCNGIFWELKVYSLRTVLNVIISCTCSPNNCPLRLCLKSQVTYSCCLWYMYWVSMRDVFSFVFLVSCLLFPLTLAHCRLQSISSKCDVEVRIEACVFYLSIYVCNTLIKSDKWRLISR